MHNIIKIAQKDNVAVAAENISCGNEVLLLSNGEFLPFRAANDIPAGHKIALCDIAAGENIIKYGASIGTASRDIIKGEHIHSHNLETALSGKLCYEYKQKATPDNSPHGDFPQFFSGYERENGDVGIRNEIWIIPTVGCVNKTAEILASKANELYRDLCDGIFAFAHPYGCSQLGDDQKATVTAVAALAKHPNASGVLLLSLGCENNNLDVMLPALGEYDKSRIRTLVTQDCEDEIEQGLNIIAKLAKSASLIKRTVQPLSRLTVGFKCGGSDAFSGITANPLCGRISDIICAAGGKVILTEVPEMFGAETRLLERAASREIFDRAVNMINGFKDYYSSHSLPVYENPSPGNKAGGITTLEEKSLGCITKGGTSPVNDVLGYCEKCTSPGLSLLWGPGNDIVSSTNLVAAGAQIIVFTTGRGTPLGAPVPTVKVATNTALAKRKSGWIDYNAGRILDGADFDTAASELLGSLISIAETPCSAKNEQNGYREIAIFKDGVTL